MGGVPVLLRPSAEVPSCGYCFSVFLFRLLWPCRFLGGHCVEGAGELIFSYLGGRKGRCKGGQGFCMVDEGRVGAGACSVVLSLRGVCGVM